MVAIRTTFVLLFLGNARWYVGGEGEDCLRIAVETNDEVSATYSGIFIEDGTGDDRRSVYNREDSKYTLMFLSKEEEYEDYVTISDLDISTAEPLDLLDDDHLERRLTTCGVWVIGRRADDDKAAFPRLRVEDCATNPADIDLDSQWQYQACGECEIEDLQGPVEVTCKSEDQATADMSSSTDLATESDSLGPDTTPTTFEDEVIVVDSSASINSQVSEGEPDTTSLTVSSSMNEEESEEVRQADDDELAESSSTEDPNSNGDDDIDDAAIDDAGEGTDGDDKLSRKEVIGLAVGISLGVVALMAVGACLLRHSNKNS